jgi:uncharacterized membrane protein YfcA
VLGVDTVSAVAAVAIVLVGGAVSGVTGFGFGLVTVPILLLIFPPPMVVAVSKGLSFVTGVSILLRDHRDVDRDFVRSVVPWAVVGLAGGLAILTRADAGLVKLLAGVVVVLFALLAVSGRPLRGIGSRHAPRLAGFASGVLNTSTGMAGPPVVLLMSGRAFSPTAFRATVTAYFIAIDLVAVPLLLQTGTVGMHEARVAVALFPVALLGRWLGRWLGRSVERERFRRLTLGLLVLTGLTAVVTAVAGLV